MNYYVTKKENISIFKASKKEQRGSDLIRRWDYNKNGTTSNKILSTLIKEFKGEITCDDKMILYPY